MPLESIRDDQERQLASLDREIARLDQEVESHMAAADSMVASMREEGRDPAIEPELFEQVDAAYLPADTAREQASRLRQRREQVAGRISGDPGARMTSSGGWAHATELLFASPGFAEIAPALRSRSQSVHVNVDPVPVLTAIEFAAQSRGFVGHATDVGALVDDDQRRFPPVPIPVRMPRIMDLVLVTTTESDNVIYTVETVRTDAAAETPVGTDSPTADYEVTEANAPVRAITHSTIVSKYSLADAGQARGYIEGRLRTGMALRADTQMVTGNGTGQNLLGIQNTSGIGSVAKSTAENRLEAIHRGITTIRLALFDEPDAVGIHPTDYEECVFEKGSDGQYLLGPASQQTSRTIWGFPAVVSSVFTLGKALPGNYRAGATAWIRSGPEISASDSHDTLFLKRQVALMGEFRMAFAAEQPQAFCVVSGI